MFSSHRFFVFSFLAFIFAVRQRDAIAPFVLPCHFSASFRCIWADAYVCESARALHACRSIFAGVLPIVYFVLPARTSLLVFVIFFRHARARFHFHSIRCQRTVFWSYILYTYILMMENLSRIYIYCMMRCDLVRGGGTRLYNAQSNDNDIDRNSCWRDTCKPRLILLYREKWIGKWNRDWVIETLRWNMLTYGIGLEEEAVEECTVQPE